ncbi:MAG: 3-hydroxyacyl-CoA dehydrogenase NAD-binding domain-containing protein, partial [Planctomycetota bacterium]
SPGGIEETAARAARMLAEGTLKPRRPKRPLPLRLLDSAPGRGIVFRKAAGGVQAKTRGLYPAPAAIIECVRTGLARGTEAGLEKESELFGKLVVSPEAKNLIRLFDAMTSLKKPMKDAEPRPVRRLGILGGGFMGAGVAGISLKLAEVTVKDISQEVLQRCAKGVWDGLGRRVRSRAISRFERDRQMARLHLTTDDAELAAADLIVEAVFEEMELKRKILAETERHVRPDAVFASNTSALPIGEIARNALHPERVLGMHYFSPVHRMPLLELVVGDRTADWAVATARALGVKQGKTVIVVKDGPGFYTSRILSPYIAEGAMLVKEGAPVEEVDRALLDFGYPVGPLALVDEIGIDVAAHVATNFGQLYADRGLGDIGAFPRLHEAGCDGRKSKRGFYLYDGRKRKGRKPVNEQVYALLGGKPRKRVPAGQTWQRLAFLMINEAAYCLQEEVIASPRDGDVGSILGLGFPPFRGGPFRYMDSLGVASAVETMERLRDAHGPRFEPAPLLRDMARSGSSFY